jgi:hypothetical protein
MDERYQADEWRQDADAALWRDRVVGPHAARAARLEAAGREITVHDSRTIFGPGSEKQPR